MKNISRKYAAWGTLLLLALAGCGDSNPEGTTPVTITLGRAATPETLRPLSERAVTQSATAVPSGISSLRLSVQAPDMATLSEEIPVTSPDPISITLTVPNGKGRAFYVEALGSRGEIVFLGAEMADLQGSPVALTVSMHYSPTFQTLFDGGDFEYAYAVTGTAGEGFLLAGYEYKGTTNESDMRLLNLRFDGQILWEKRYGGGGSESARAIERTDDGGYLVAGQISEAGNSDVLLLKVNSGGDIEWQTVYSFQEYENTSDLVRTPDGGFLLLATSQSMITYQMDILLLRLNSQGELLWSKILNTGVDENALDIVCDADGNILITGDTGGGVGVKLLAVKLDSAGTVLWSHHYSSVDDLYGTQAVPTDDGGFLITGRAFSSTGADDVLLLRIDSSGQPVWGYSYGSGLPYQDVGYAIAATSDSQFLVGGVTSSFGDNSSNGLLMKFDSSGTPVWQNYYGGGGPQEIYAFYVLPFDQILATGYSVETFGSESDIFAVKLHRDGASPAALENPIAMTRTSLAALTAAAASPTIADATLTTAAGDLVATETVSLPRDIQTSGTTTTTTAP